MSEDKECREEFEVWARDNGYVVTRALDGEWYSQQGTDRAWDVWQGCWSRAAKPAVPEGLVELLRELRPNYGDVGSRDVDVAEKQRKIDAAIALLSAAPPLPVAQGGLSIWGYSDQDEYMGDTLDDYAKERKYVIGDEFDVTEGWAREARFKITGGGPSASDPKAAFVFEEIAAPTPPAAPPETKQ